MHQKQISIMVQKLNNIFLILIVVITSFVNAQTPSGEKLVYTDFNNDSTFKKFEKNKNAIAYAQINALKTGSLLVRLNTNAKLISNLKATGKADLATNVQLETYIKNKIIMSAYKKEFDFCPVYFFYSESSDSVRKNMLNGIFVDTTLNVNPNIKCNASFFLIAEVGDLYNSSIGFVPEEWAKAAVERGAYARSAGVVVKNKYFIQLHKPFPYFQIKNGAVQNSKLNKDGLFEDIEQELKAYKKASRDLETYKQIKSIRKVVAGFNTQLYDFYEAHKTYVATPEIKQFVY